MYLAKGVGAHVKLMSSYAAAYDAYTVMSDSLQPYGL